ncbi:MAG: type II toxin-antitoxin system VapB family antitoxin [Alphaproteobacteria bacterium]|nr:type II toxin-antitoxin system VapB family antitoxin [Alphaproteobacteria bacterium]
MGLNIKKASTEAAIRKLAAHTGESLTDAVENAVGEKLARMEEEARRKAPAKTVEELLAAIKPLQEESAAYRKARGDNRSFEQFMKDFDDEFYDEAGAPK